MSYRMKKAGLIVLGLALVVFLSYEAVVLCLIYSKVTAFVSSNFAMNTNDHWGIKYTITRFEPEWREDTGWVVRRDIRRYRKNSFYILPSNRKADTEFHAALAIYRQRWTPTSLASK